MSTDLKQRTTKGIAWGLINNGATQILNLFFGIVLARMLTPREYGIVGVLTVFTLIAGNLQACGFTQGLCNLGRPQRYEYNSVFWFNITISTFLYLILFFCAPLIADFFNAPELLWLSRFIFLGFWLSSFSIMQNAYMYIHMMVKETAIVGIAALAVSGIVGIVLAFYGFSYWALAWQQVTYTIVLCIGRYIVSPFKPMMKFDFSPIKKMLPFSVKMMLTTMVTSLSQNILTFIFGKLYAMKTVGNYSQANKWSVMASSLLQNTINQIAQPILKEISDDRQRLLRVLRKMIRFAAFASFPAMLGLAMIADEFIIFTIGEKWINAANMLRILSIGASTLPIVALLQNLAISHSRSGLILCLNSIQIALQIGIAILLYHQGIDTIVAAIAGILIVFMFLWQICTSHISGGYTMWMFIKDTMPFALISAIVMLLTYFATSSLNDIVWLQLLCRIAMAAVLYILILFLFKAEILNECLQFLRKKK